MSLQVSREGVPGDHWPDWGQTCFKPVEKFSSWDSVVCCHDKSSQAPVSVCDGHFSPAADGTGHSKERHEPTSARVHGDVLHEEGPGCSDGDLQETHHPERRKVTPARAPSDHLRWGGAVCSSNTPETVREWMGIREGDERRVALCFVSQQFCSVCLCGGNWPERRRQVVCVSTFSLQPSTCGEILTISQQGATCTAPGCTVWSSLGLAVFPCDLHHVDVTAAASSCATPHPPTSSQHNCNLGNDPLWAMSLQIWDARLLFFLLPVQNK